MKVKYIKQVGKIPVGRIAQVTKDNAEELVSEGVAAIYEGTLSDGQQETSEEDFKKQVNTNIKAIEEEE